MTTLKKAQKARIKAQDANKAKTEFLAYMSHEIRNPASVIISLSNILAASDPLTPRQQDLIRTLQLSSNSLISLLNDFLDITKIEAGRMNLENIPFSLYQTLQDVGHMISPNARSKGLEFIMQCESVKDRVFLGDPARLRQMMLNLCSNAIKFTDKGMVDILVASKSTAVKMVEDISISVSDTGIGIAPEKQKKIFEKFSQGDPAINRKYGGTGLGLSITKRLAQAMGGSISVQSRPGKGSIFTLHLPLALSQERIIVA